MAENPRIEELRRRLEREPGSRAFAQLAEEFRKEGNHAEAIRVARAGLQQQANYPSARMTLGRALLDSGDLAAARLEFETVLRGAPDNILASRFLAECLEGLGDLGSALLQFRAAQRLAPSDKHVEGQIRALEEKLSAPTMVRKSPELTPDVLAPPRVPSLPTRATATAEFPTPVVSAPPVPSARPPLPLPPEPEPAASPTIVEESFDLEAPFNAPTRLRAEEAPLPGRSLPDEPDASDAPTLPAAQAPAFDFLPATPSAPVEARTVPPPPAPEPAPPPPVTRAQPEPVREVVAPAAEPPGDAIWRAPAPPRARGLEATQEISRHSRAAAAARDSVDTTRVPVVTFPLPPAPSRPAIDAVRLEWAPAPDRPVEPATAVPAPAPVAAVPAVVEVPAPPPPAPPAPAPAAVAPVPVAAPEPLLSPTLAELYFSQGALDKAIEVYEQLIRREPANGHLHVRLGEIRQAASPPSVPPDAERAARRLVIEKQIARLEQLLTLVRRA